MMILATLLVAVDAVGERENDPANKNWFVEQSAAI